MISIIACALLIGTLLEQAIGSLLTLMIAEVTSQTTAARNITISTTIKTRRAPGSRHAHTRTHIHTPVFEYSIFVYVSL